MIHDLHRRLSAIRRSSGVGNFDKNMPLLLAKFHWDVEGCLEILRPYQREFGPLLADGGFATWQAHERIDQLVPEHLKCPPDPAAVAATASATHSLTIRKQRAFEALKFDATDSQVAHAAGISHTTLWRWMQQPAFRAAWLAIQRERYWQACDTLQDAPEAVEVLNSIIQDPNASPHTRLRAAHLVGREVTETLDLLDLDTDIAQAEEASVPPPAPCNTPLPEPSPTEPLTPPVSTESADSPESPDLWNAAKCGISEPAHPPNPTSRIAAHELGLAFHTPRPGRPPVRKPPGTD